MTPIIATPGRIVLYRLCESDVREIAERRRAHHVFFEWKNEHGSGFAERYAFRGNGPSVGDVYPLVITRVWGDTAESCINGQVLLDGDDTLWVTSRSQVVEGPDETGMWPFGRWVVPPRSPEHVAPSAVAEGVTA